MRIAICTTLAAFVMDNPHTWGFWLRNVDQVTEHAKSVNAEVDYFAAIELDGRNTDPFVDLFTALQHIGGHYWTYHLDDGRTSVTTDNRLRHLTMGQNLASEFATSGGYDWMLFMAADCMPPDDVIPKLLEMNHPLVGCEIPTYGLRGPKVDKYPFPVQEQLISAAAIMAHREIFKRLRWRADADLGMSDDPSYQYDAQHLLGVPSYVRKDCKARHYPEAISSIETRFPKRDMRVYE